jgi:hypothetical protein
MPTPGPNEKQDDFVSRCIPIVLRDGTAKDQAQAAAVCNSMWQQAQKASTNEVLELSLSGDRAVEFSGSPRNPYGTHASRGYPGGRDGWKNAWRVYLTGVNQGAIQGTIRRIAMIAAGMKPACQLPEQSAEEVGPRSGASGRLEGKIHEHPKDYGLSAWKTPGDDNLQREDIQLTCQDLKDLKTMCLKEIRKRQQARQAQEAIYHEVEITPRTTEAQQFEGREWDVTLIGPDGSGDVVTVNGTQYLRSKNGRLYNVAALAASAPTWEGTKVYDNHLTDQEFQDRAGMRSVAREWIGSIVNPRWDAGTSQLRGVLKVVEESVARKLKNAWDAGILKTIGLSIDTLTVQGQEATLEGKAWPTVEGFQKILSVDLVAEPAAGGGFNRLIAAQINQEVNNPMNEQELKTLVTRLVTEALAGKNVGDDKKEALVNVVYQAAMGAKAAEAEDVEAAVKPLVEALVVVEAAPAQENPAPEPPAASETPAQPSAATQEQVRRLECKLELRDKLDAAKLDATHRAVISTMFDGRIFEAAELDRAVEAQKAAQAAHDPSGRVTGAGGGNGVSVGLNEQDRHELEFMRLVMGHNDFRSLESVEVDYVQERVTESYRAWKKAGRPSNLAAGRPVYRLSEWLYEVLGGNPLVDTRAYEAVTTSGMSSIVKNTVNIMLANDYAKRTEWWAPLVRTEEVDTIDQATLVRTYGLSTLSVVDEGQAYTELSWADEEETASFAKRGNFVGVTLETLLSDKVNVVRRLPQRLSVSWYNTMSALNAAVFTTNTATGPALADTGALFNATAVGTATGHANLLTTALSYTAYGAVRLAMRKQTDQVLGAGEKLLITPKFVLVPVDLESTARPIFDTQFLPGSANNDKNPYYNEAQVIVVPTWTDTNNWAAVGDPMEFPAIWNIFIRGNRVPSIFTAGDESSGAMFTNDTLRYKVRMLSFRFSSTYDCAPVSDFRPLHKSNVT